MKFLVVAGMSFLLAHTAVAKERFDRGGESPLLINGGAVVGSVDPVSKMTVLLVSFIQGADGSVGQGICTGTLIAEDTILTAAHCIADRMAVVFARSINEASEANIVPGLGVRHPDYKETTPTPQQLEEMSDDERIAALTDLHDVAVVFFQGGLRNGYTTASLLNQDVVPGLPLTVAGFGQDSTVKDEAKKTGILKKAELHVIRDTYGVNEFVMEQHLDNGVCSGDSGGPAYLEHEGTYYVMGVTSRGGRPDIDEKGNLKRDENGNIVFLCDGASVHTKAHKYLNFYNAAIAWFRENVGGEN